MARGRIIDKQIFLNEALAHCSVQARYLYQGTIIHADDEGRMKASPMYLKGLIFPFDEAIRADTVKKWRDEIVNAEVATLYVAGGQEYLAHPNWEKYQTLRKDRVKPSDCPPPPSGLSTVVDILPSLVGQMSATCHPEPNRTEPNPTQPNRKGARAQTPTLDLPQELEFARVEIKSWLDYKREKGQIYKPKGLDALFKKLMEFPRDTLKRAIENSMASNYAGIFAPNENGGRNAKHGASYNGQYAGIED